MRTQEEIMQSMYKIYTVYFYLHPYDIRREIIINAADLKEAEEIAPAEVAARFPSFADTIHIQAIVS